MKLRGFRHLLRSDEHHGGGAPGSSGIFDIYKGQMSIFGYLICDTGRQVTYWSGVQGAEPPEAQRKIMPFQQHF